MRLFKRFSSFLLGIKSSWKGSSTFFPSTVKLKVLSPYIWFKSSTEDISLKDSKAAWYAALSGLSSCLDKASRPFNNSYLVIGNDDKACLSSQQKEKLVFLYREKKIFKES